MEKYSLHMPFGTFLGHVRCKEGSLVDSTKVIVIVEMVALTLVKDLCTTLGHTSY